MNILFIGDIVGRPGRDLVRHGLPALAAHYGVDLVIANAENAAARLRHHARDWRRDCRLRRRRHDVRQSHLGQEGGARLHRHRAAAAPSGQLPGRRAGRGSYLARTRDGRRVGVVNVMGRVFMANIDDPFAVGAPRDRGARGTHARRSSSTCTPRRRPRSWRWGGISTARSRAVVGTHTHVQTADDRHPAEGHGLPDRRRDDRPARFDHRLTGRAGARPVPHRPAGRASRRPRATRGSTPSSSRRTNRPGRRPTSSA